MLPDVLTIVAFLSSVITICSLIVTYVAYYQNSIVGVVIYTSADPNKPK